MLFKVIFASFKVAESGWQDAADDDKIMQVKDVHVFKRFLQANYVHFGLILPLKPFFQENVFSCVSIARLLLPSMLERGGHEDFWNTSQLEF